jgi:hypothetical protein
MSEVVIMPGFLTTVEKARLHMDAGMIQVTDAKTDAVIEVPAGNIKPGKDKRPQLFIVEEYTLRSFKGDLARDELISSFSVSGHSTLTYNIFSKTATHSTTTLSTTVMESLDSLATSTFNTQLKASADSRFGKNNYDYQMDANFHGEAEWGISDGSVDADVHAKGSTQEVRNELSSSTSSAIDAQIAATNDLRTQRASVDTQVKDTETVTESRMTKEITNPGDVPINVGVYQVKEEVVTLLCLTGVRLAFKNTVSEDDQQVTLRNIDSLLDDVLEKPEDRKVLKSRIKSVLEDVRDYQDESRNLLEVDPGNPSSFELNRSLKSTYQLKKPDGTVRRSIEVDGIIIRDYRRYIRKPGTSVELPIRRV